MDRIGAWLSNVFLPMEQPAVNLTEDLLALLDHELSVEELPRRVLALIQASLTPDVCCVYQRRPGEGSFAVVAQAPEDFWQRREIVEQFARRPADQWAIGQAVRTGQWRLIDDTKKAQREGSYVPFSEEIRSELVIPIATRDLLVHRKQITAVLVASWRRPISAHQLPPMTILTRLLDIAFSAAVTRYHRDRRLTLLHALGTLDPGNTDELLTSFLVALDEAVPCKFISLWLYDRMSERLAVRAFYPKYNLTFASFEHAVVTIDACACGPAVTTGEPLLLSPLPSAYANPKLAQQLGLDWMIAIPLRSSELTPFALINLYPHGAPDDFDDARQLQLLALYVSPVASAIRLSQLLYEEDLLGSLGFFLDRCLEFDDSERWWNSLANAIQRVMACQGCSIFILADGRDLVLRGSTGIEGDPPYSMVRYQLTGEVSATSFAFAKGESVIYYRDDMGADVNRAHRSRWREKTVGRSRSILFVPIRNKGGQPIGLIRCNNKDERPGRGLGVFTSEDRSHLERLAALVSSAWAPTHWMRERNQARQRRTRAIQHELLGPVQALKDHGGWLHTWNAQPPAEHVSRLGLVVADMARHTDLIDLVYSSLGQLEDVRPTIRRHRFNHLVTACRRFLYVEKELKWVDLQTGDIGVDWVECDDLHMMRVLFNLLRNAVKYRDRTATTRYIALRARQRGPLVAIEVEDNGIGVPPGEEDRIFLEGERGSNARALHPTGEGLGLHYCKVIMQAHQGTILLESPRQPTVFRISWPSQPVGRTVRE